MDTHRYIYAVNFFICAILCGISLFYNTLRHLPLCPLCSLQVLIYYIIAIVSLITFFVLPRRPGRIGYGIFMMILTAFGIFFAGRLVWMNHLPNIAQYPCAPDMLGLFLQGKMDAFFQSFSQIFNHCTLPNWRFIGLGIPTWSLAWMSFLFLTGLYAVTRPCGKSSCKPDFDD